MLTKRMIIMLAITGLILGAILLFVVGKGIMIGHFMAGMSSQPQTVSSTVVGYEE